MPTRLKLRTKLRFAFLLIPMLTLFGCGGSDSNSDTSPDPGNEVVEPDPSYQVSVDVSGLVGTLTLQLTAGSVTDDVSASADGRANFSAAVVPAQTNYSVVITAQPTGQHCSLSENSNGTLATETQITITATCEVLPTAAKFSLSYGLKQFKFSWDAVAGATHYQLYENADGHSGFTVIASDLTTTAYDLDVVLYNKINARYLVSACNDHGDCADSNTVIVSDNLIEAIGYVKAANTGRGDLFGASLALSADGNTLVVGATTESGDAESTAENPNDNANAAGAVYVFVKSGNQWSQQAYLKATNADAFDNFGYEVALSDDGNRLVVGAYNEHGSTHSTIDDSDNDVYGAGAVYVFSRNNAIWIQEAYLKSLNEGMTNAGVSVAISGDGNTLAFGAYTDSGDASSTVDALNTNATFAGATYVYTYSNGWNLAAYLKASNAESMDEFGGSVALSQDGSLLAVGARLEDGDSDSTAANANNNAENAGAVYIFEQSESRWTQTAYIKAPNASVGGRFGSVALSDDGVTLIVGAFGEAGDADSTVADTNANAADAGAAYIYQYQNSSWQFQSYLKADNAVASANFGSSIAISADGKLVAIGAVFEPSNAVGISRESSSNQDASQAGAVYLYEFIDDRWQQKDYIKASNTALYFGSSVAFDGDGNLAVGAMEEGNSALGIGFGVTTSDDLSELSGAVYLY